MKWLYAKLRRSNEMALSANCCTRDAAVLLMADVLEPGFLWSMRNIWCRRCPGTDKLTCLSFFNHFLVRWGFQDFCSFDLSTLYLFDVATPSD